MDRNYAELAKRLVALEGELAEMTASTKRLVEASFRQNSRAETQVNTLNAPVVAYCVSTIDPLKLNRVRIFHPLLCRPEAKVKDLPFARACSNAGGIDDCGMAWVPPAGSSVLVVFEHGARQSPIYLGTLWQKYRGPGANPIFPYPIDEFKKLWADEDYRGRGYLLGGTDGSQCFPPWDTETNNGINYESESDLDLDPDAQLKVTYPNIYGWKTPGKHMIKMVDGDHRCNNKWKRFEIASACGNTILLKDDWYHPSGDWSNPKQCSPSGKPDQSECDTVSALLSLEVSGLEDANEEFTGAAVGATGSGTAKTGCKDAPPPVKCSNPYYKRQEECRPYRGAETPSRNRSALPQSGIQIQCISGHQMVMDDSVEQPKAGRIKWYRDFDYGCNNTYKGKFYFKSSTGHLIELNDTEDEEEVRGADNGIRLQTAAGNFLRMNDHSLEDCTAGETRGIELGSTAGHTFVMRDAGNEQCSPVRTAGGVPVNKAKEAFVQLRTGYGLILRMDDSTDQEETRKQFVMLAATRKTDDEKPCRSSHMLLMQLDEAGGGFVELVSGGKMAFASTEDCLQTVGTEDCKANKLTNVFGNYLIKADEICYIKSKTQLNIADEYIILGAGTSCPLPDDETAEEEARRAREAAGGAVTAASETGESQKSGGPCIFPIIIARDPVVCKYTGIIHWTKYSNTVFASAEEEDETGAAALS